MFFDASPGFMQPALETKDPAFRFDICADTWDALAPKTTKSHPVRCLRTPGESRERAAILIMALQRWSLNRARPCVFVQQFLDCLEERARAGADLRIDIVIRIDPLSAGVDAQHADFWFVAMQAVEQLQRPLGRHRMAQH